MYNSRPDNDRVKLLPPYRDYEISPSGQIYSHKRNRIITPIIDRNGYLIIRLHDGNGGRQSKAVARLVAETYLPRKGALRNTILYKDYDRTNCHVNNLRWVTRSYAMRYERQLEDREKFNNPQDTVRVSVLGDDHLPMPCGTIAEAAEKYGLLYHEVMISAREENPCPSDVRYTFHSDHPLEAW